MCHCWDCLQKAHCSLRGSMKAPCKYYIGRADNQPRHWSSDAANQLPRPWHVQPGAAAKAGEREIKRG
jgi:hypothetical protein